MKPIAHGACAIAALFAFQFTGEAVVRMAGLPLPGPLAGMLLLFLALARRGKVPASFEKTTRQLLQHFMLLLLPSIAGINDPAVCGFAIGLTAHAIGTARELQFNATAGAFAALAMGLNGVATALLVPLAMGLFHARGFLL